MYIIKYNNFFYKMKLPIEILVKYSSPLELEDFKKNNNKSKLFFYILKIFFGYIILNPSINNNTKLLLNICKNNFNILRFLSCNEGYFFYLIKGEKECINRLMKNLYILHIEEIKNIKEKGDKR